MNKYDELFAKTLNYYNNDNGIDLPDDMGDLRSGMPYRAWCANVAWCMFNKERFWEYYNKSEFWKLKFATASRFYGSKLFYHKPWNEDSHYVKEINRAVLNNLGKKFILSPKPLEVGMDIDTVNMIVVDVISQ